jgi:hypothetical protein
VVTSTTASFATKPPDRWSAILTSYSVPNAIVFAVLVLATYVIYRPVTTLLEASDLSASSVARDILGIGTLLLGMTAAGRIPRLTHRWHWWAISAALLVLSMIAYADVTCARTRRLLGTTLTDSVVATSDETTNGIPLPGALRLPACRSDEVSDVNTPLGRAQARRATTGLIAVAALLALLSGVLSSWVPRWGVKILPAAGVAVVFYIVADVLRDSSLAGNPLEKASLWPVILGGLVFFYLWWLATLLFDLVFVWQRYVRYAAVHANVADLAAKGYEPTQLEKKLNVIAEAAAKKKKDKAQQKQNAAPPR